MQTKRKNDDKPKNNAGERRISAFFAPMVLGLGSILWLGIVGLLQFPVYGLLSQYISDSQVAALITGTLSISLYILGIVFFLIYRFRGKRKQSPKLKNEDGGGKSQARLGVYAFLWLWAVAMIHILAHTLLPRYFPGIDMQNEFFSFLTPVLYMSGALFIMYRHYKTNAS